MRASQIALVAAALSLTAASAAGQEAEQPLRMLTSFVVQNLDPAQSGFWMAEFGVAELLVQFRADGEHHPWLLESFESVDDLTWVLTLREDVAFQNGKPVDAEAVVATIERQLEHSPSARGVVPEDARFTVTGPLEITVETDAPFPSLPGVLASESVFMIYDAEAVDAVDGDWEELAGSGFYTGPYTLETLDSSGMTMSRNEGYWQGQPALPGVEVGFVTDPNARILAVQNGEADIALYPPIAVKPVVDATPGIHFNHGTPGSGGFMLFTNLEQPPFDDPLMRRAVQHAIDFEEIARDVFAGVADPAVGLYQPIVPWALELQGTDADEARRLMDEAGWVQEGNGIRTRDGQPLAVTFLTYPQQADSEAVGRALQAQLRGYGWDVSLLSVDDMMVDMMENNVDWNAGISSATPVGFGGSPESFINTYLMTGGRWNYGPLANDELNALGRELQVTVDPDQRTEILHAIQRIVIEEEAYPFPLIFSRPRVVVNDAWRDYMPGFNLFHIGWDTAPTGD